MRVLLTGGSGFIGAQVVAPLRALGFEVHALGRRQVPGTVHHAVDLMDGTAMQTVVSDAKATHLLHLAWYVEPGRFWRSPRNLDWVGASLGLVRAFAEAGGRRIVVAGSCAEYAWGPARLREDAFVLPETIYGVSKDALRRVVEQFGREFGLSVAWGRVFFLYGPNEPAGRLVSDAISALTSGARLATSHGRQRRDFMHVSDVARAFAGMTASGVEGSINVGSGNAVPVREVLRELAALVGGMDRIDFGVRTLAANEPDVVEADVTRLHNELRFSPNFDLRTGLQDTVRWWRD